MLHGVKRACEFEGDMLWTHKVLCGWSREPNALFVPFETPLLTSALLSPLGLDANNLKLNLSAGDAVLTNLKLKKSALETLELPITIKNGTSHVSYLPTTLFMPPFHTIQQLLTIPSLLNLIGPYNRPKTAINLCGMASKKAFLAN